MALGATDRSTKTDEGRSVGFRHAVDDHVRTRAVTLDQAQQNVRFLGVSDHFTVPIDRDPPAPVSLHQLGLHEPDCTAAPGAQSAVAVRFGDGRMVVRALV